MAPVGLDQMNTSMNSLLHVYYNKIVPLTFAERLTRFHFSVATPSGREQSAKVQRRQLVAPHIDHRLQRYQLFGILLNRKQRTCYSRAMRSFRFA